jgi:hypothetical protein
MRSAAAMDLDEDSALLAAWQAAKADADAVENVWLAEPSLRGEHARSEGQILNRLRSPEHDRLVGEAWLHIGRYQKNGDEGQRAIKAMLKAFTLSKNVRQLPDDYQRSRKLLQKLENSANELHKYFTDTIERDPLWRIVTDSPTGIPDLRNVRATLGQIKEFLSYSLAEFSDAYAQAGLTREVKASVGPRVTFTTAMSLAMCDIFGRPLDNVVCNLAQVVFKSEDVTVDQVKKARKTAQRRRGSTEAPKIRSS